MSAVVFIIIFSMGFFIELSTKSPNNISETHDTNHIIFKERPSWNQMYNYKNLTASGRYKNMIWCKVPKAGSSTIAKIFLHLAGVNVANKSGGFHKIIRDYYPSLPKKSMKTILNSSSTFKFLVVRDPFERILSAYRDKLENYEINPYFFETYGKFMVPEVNCTIQAPSWSQFVAYLTKTPKNEYNEHWMPIHQLCTTSCVHYDAIIKLENLDKDIQIVLDTVGIQNAWTGRAGPKTFSSDPKIIQKYYCSLLSGEIKMLYLIYRKDFDVFGYNPIKYFKMCEYKI